LKFQTLFGIVLQPLFAGMCCALRISDEALQIQRPVYPELFIMIAQLHSKKVVKL